MANSDVRFIRRKGRVIPIRRKKKENHGIKAAVGLTGATVGAGLVGDASGNMVLKSEKIGKDGVLDRFKLDRYKRKYSKLFEAAGPVEIKTTSLIRGGFLDPYDLKITLGRGGGKNTLLHELGHLKALNNKSSINRFNIDLPFKLGVLKKEKRGKFTYIFEPKGGGRFERLKRKGRKKLLSGARRFVELGSEAEATFHALKERKRVAGFRGVAKGLKTLAPAYGTYVAHAAKPLLGIYGAYHGIKYIRKKLKNR